MTDTERASSLERLMNAYGDEIKRFCAIQLKDAFQAEDAAQDTFVKAWKALDSYRMESSEKTWLIRIAVNTCRDYQRTGWFRHTERRFSSEDLPEQGQEAIFPDGTVTSAVAALPSRIREAILLRYYQELTIAETSSAMRVSSSTVKRMLKKGHALLGRQLKGWYFDEEE